MPSKLIMKDILQFPRGHGTESVESYHTMGPSHQEANQAMLYEGNTGYLKCVTEQVLSDLGTDNHNI